MAPLAPKYYIVHLCHTRCSSSSGQPRLFLIYSPGSDKSMPVTDMKSSVEFGVGLCFTSQRQYWVCKYILLALGFCSLSVFAQSCGEQNQHLCRNAVAGNSGWWGKRTKLGRCQRHKWCLVHTYMQAWLSRSRPTGQSCLCFFAQLTS